MNAFVRLCLGGFFCLIFVTASSAEISPQAKQWLENPNGRGAATLSDIDRADAIRELRKELNANEDLTTRRFLVRLGEQQAINECLNFIRNPKTTGRDRAQSSFYILKECTTEPWPIPILAEDLTLPLTSVDPDVWLPSRIAMSMDIMLDILANSPAFPAETRASAKTRGYSGLPQLRDTLLTWWEQNKEAFARKDYAAVKPLMPVAQTPVATNAVPAKALVPSPGVVPAPNRSPTTPVPTAPAPATDSQSDWHLPFAFLTLAAAGVAALILWRSRRGIR